MQDTSLETKPEPVKAEWESVNPNHAPVQPVIITGINIPFFSLVGLMVKLAIAAVPAAIIASLVWMVVAALFIGSF